MCRDFIRLEGCKPCLFLSAFQFAKLIIPYLHHGGFVMRKRKCTRIQNMLPVIEGMIAFGMNHQEIEIEPDLEGDRPIHNLLKRQRHKEENEKPKYRGRKTARHCRNTSTKTSGWRWKRNYCGIFCDWPEENEATNKVPNCLYQSQPLSRVRDVSFSRCHTAVIMTMSGIWISRHMMQNLPASSTSNKRNVIRLMDIAVCGNGSIGKRK